MGLEGWPEDEEAAAAGGGVLARRRFRARAFASGASTAAPCAEPERERGGGAVEAGGALAAAGFGTWLGFARPGLYARNTVPGAGGATSGGRLI